MGFFQSLGFDIPARKGIPDFLQEVSGQKDQQVHDSLLSLCVTEMTDSQGFPVQPCSCSFGDSAGLDLIKPNLIVSTLSEPELDKLRSAPLSLPEGLDRSCDPA